MEFVYPDIVSRGVYQYGFWEAAPTTMLLTHLKPGMVFFDVGTHFGYFTRLASHLVGSGGQVHSFEPTPRTFEVLRRNTEDRAHIHLEQAAAFSDDTTLEFTDFGLKLGAYNTIGKARVEDDRQVKMKPLAKFQVRALSLDNYIARCGVRPNMIKLDAEGAEPSIIKGMERTLTEVRPHIILEVGDVNSDKQGESRANLQRIADHGYEAWQYDPSSRRLVPHTLQTQYAADNILMSPAAAAS